MIGFKLTVLFLALLRTGLAQKLPNVTLPWGKWQAAPYAHDPKASIPSTGRTQMPNQPGFFHPRSHYGPACYQIQPKALSNPPGGSHSIQAPRDSLEQSEDCLFFDVYAPASAFDQNGNPIEKLPVIVWIYGGAYAFGSKDLGGGLPVYTAIFVAGNYRLGAFGWLAGSYMQDKGQPNAGLYGPAPLLDWVQKYVGQAGGDASQVSAWGESAGAGSVLHHLVREVSPGFKTFLAQSPAFEWSWDISPDGTLDTIYRNFSSHAKCGFRYEIECLRGARVEDLERANQQLFDVTASFTPSYVVSQASFDAFLLAFFPEPSLGSLLRYGGDFRACVGELIRDSTFACNTRQLFDAFPSVSYMMRYALPADGLAVNATDVIATFMNGYDDAYHMLRAKNIGIFEAALYAGVLATAIKTEYQSYLSSFAVSGNPNTASTGSIYWPVVHYMSSGFVSDQQNTKQTCGLGQEIAWMIRKIGKGSPGGGRVSNEGEPTDEQREGATVGKD
ncbi:carboxylesterase family protein [Lasiosphaeria ovina]|uniref:Carboxylesterase family protein n=1 Tax=Lasiosphaeria ovina TaxID=92902 RepID=A0AAE0N0L3_9PEZI|nr:carboxylesterase family protein [Lasiosphaeria ovina]